MSLLENCQLWNTAFGQRSESSTMATAREGLKVALLKFRDRAEQLVAQIPKDLKHLTVHDISHLDALWEYADVIVGPDFELNPVEGFVLGGAFLVHDAGMSLAAYPGGYEDLRRHPRWKDSLSITLHEKLGKAPTASELKNPSLSAEKATLELLLRELHAEQAERITDVAWGCEGQSEYHLIDDPDLRNALGPVIGRLGLSHWCPLSQIATEFKTALGAPLSFPKEWVVDPLRLACVVRLADAAHLDWRRPRGFCAPL